MKDNNEEQDFDERNEDEEGKNSSTPLIFLGFKTSNIRKSCYLAKLLATLARHHEGWGGETTQEDKTFMCHDDRTLHPDGVIAGASFGFRSALGLDRFV